MPTKAPSKYEFYRHKCIVTMWVTMICAFSGFTLAIIGGLIESRVGLYILLSGLAMLIVSFFLSLRTGRLMGKSYREWNTDWFNVTRYAWVSVRGERATNYLAKFAKPGVAGLNPITLWMGEREVICRRPDHGLMDQLVAGQPVYGRLRYSDELESWELEALPIPDM